VAVALLSGVLFGLVPAMQSARPNISQVIQAGTRRLTRGVKGRRTHTALIASQTALTLLLMAAIGAAIRGFMRLNHVSLGYDPQHVMSVIIPLREDEHTIWADNLSPHYWKDSIKSGVASENGSGDPAADTGGLETTKAGMAQTATNQTPCSPPTAGSAPATCHAQ
jgi:hypothetical protein